MPVTPGGFSKLTIAPLWVGHTPPHNTHAHTLDNSPLKVYNKTIQRNQHKKEVYF